MHALPVRLDRLQAAASELASATGSECLPLQADVRNPKQLQDAVAKTVEKFGRIDFVICGMPSTADASANADIAEDDALTHRCCWEFPRADLQAVRERL